MPIFLGSIQYVGSTGSSAYPLPSSTTNGAYLQAGSNNTAFWSYPGSQTVSGTFATRSILTHGYMAGGYKGGAPWRSLNKTWHSSDTTIYLGEQLDRHAAYNGGSFSDFNAYVHGTSTTDISSGLGNFAVAALASTHTSSYNLHTGLARIVSFTGTSYSGPQGAANPWSTFGYTGKDPSGDGVNYGSAGGTLGTGNMEMTVARSYFGACQDQTGQVGYIGGGSQTQVIDRMHFPTEIMYVHPNNTPATAASHTAAVGGETISYWSFAGSLQKMTYSTGAWSAWSLGSTVTSPTLSTDGVCKFLGTKLGYHYGGTGANNTSGFGRWTDSTGIMTSNSLSKPIANGEENFQMGQNWGYCIGTYNGNQINYSYKTIYSTGVSTAGGHAMEPKGHVGASSGVTSSASAMITSGAI
jgi:hypothetical protein